MPLEQPLAPAGGQGGGGGSVLGGTVQIRDSVLRGGGGGESTPPPPQNGDDDSIVRTLTECGVFVLAPARLRATAVALAAAGIDAEQVRQLASFIAGTEDDEGKRRKYLASVLSSAERAKQAVAGLNEHRLAAAQLPTTSGPTHMVNMPIGTTSCHCVGCVQARAKQPSPEPWDHDRMCRIAKCLVDGDKKSVAYVADLLGVSETTVGLMVPRGRVLSQSAVTTPKGLTAKQVDATEKIERDRRAEFARQMREARQVLS